MSKTTQTQTQSQATPTQATEAVVKEVGLQELMSGSLHKLEAPKPLDSTTSSVVEISIDESTAIPYLFERVKVSDPRIPDYAGCSLYTHIPVKAIGR